MTNWLRRRPMLLYFAMAFGISWGGIAIVLAATGFSLVALQPLETGLIFVAMLLGPSVGGLILIVLSDGGAGLRQLGADLLRWKADVRWYAVALLTAPLLLLAILLPLSAFVDPAFVPRFQWPLLAAGLLAGSFEEIGWTGFATPRLLARHRIGMAGFVLGLIWAFWHMLVDFRSNIAAMGVAWPLEFAIVYVATLTPYRMMMTWAYSKHQSLPLAILMHASFTGWLMALFPIASLEQSLFWQSLFALALWGAVAMAPGRSAPPNNRSAIGRAVAPNAGLGGVSYDGRSSTILRPPLGPVLTAGGAGDCRD